MKDGLGDRIKQNYESRTRQFLPRRTYTIIRIDGKAFSNWTRGLEKPFDSDFLDDMDSTAIELCRQIQGCQFAYTQSDEISLLLTDFSTPTTDAWFDGNVQKMASVAASTAAGVFMGERMGRDTSSQHAMDNPPAFDARVFTIPDRNEVKTYFQWRGLDASRNSIQMMARFVLGHSAIEGKSAKEQMELLRAAGKPWEELPTRVKRGQIIRKEQQMKEVVLPNGEAQQILRKVWIRQDPPIFTKEPGYLDGLIPIIPTPGDDVIDDTSGNS